MVSLFITHMQQVDKDEQSTKAPLVLWIAGILILIFVSVIAAAFIGSVNLFFIDVFKVIRHHLWGCPLAGVKDSAEFIVWELRLPRALLALAVGGGLAVAGVAMQAVTQNVMAEPYTIGVSSGALLAVTSLSYLGFPHLQNSMAISIAAFCGALAAMALVYNIGTRGTGRLSNHLILTGMAVSIIFNAASNYFIITMPAESSIRGVLNWMMGSLSNARWHNIGIPFFGILLSTVYFFRHGRDFDTISLGNETALSLGVNVVKLRKVSILFIALITGLTVACAGIIGLVGFIIPHVLRFISGANHQRLLPISFLCGGLFLIWMDVLARIAVPPQEIPIGIFTALCGGPVFVSLLIRKNR